VPEYLTLGTLAHFRHFSSLSGTYIMNWLRIDNPEINAQKLQSEIETEIEQLQNDPEISASLDEGIKGISALKTPEETPALVEIAEAYAAGWDAATLARRWPALKPFLPLLEKILKRFLRPQYIFNSLLLEIIRHQEERIQDLEQGKTGRVRKNRDYQ